ncbi:MAG: alpha-glucuronidase, partial [Cyclobacteriaceae bacterium]|nr:alpha-glucuronidase [Cyclobacteriaceae bacterium]
MKILALLFFLFTFHAANSESGYRLWLRYDKIENQHLLNEYRQQIKNLLVDGDSPTLRIIQEELLTGLTGLLDQPISLSSNPKSKSLLIITTFKSDLFKLLKPDISKVTVGNEGFIIKTISSNNTNTILIAAPEEVGVLYGAFHFLRLIQTNTSIKNLSIEQSPKIKLRLLNHWDNLDRTVERGYAGFSIWNWHK